MSKTLVIVLSETRAHELTFDNFKKNVIDELDADLCLCIGVKPDYDYNNSFYNLAKYKFTYDEPDDFGDAFEEAYNIISKNKPKYECLHNVNALYGKIQNPQHSTENITYYGINDNHLTNLNNFTDDEVVIHTEGFPDNSWKNQVYGIKNSNNAILVSQENVITYKKPLYWREFLKVKDQFLGGIKDDKEQHPGSAGILIFFRWFLLKSLIENDLINKYDRFVITRSDFIYQLPHPKVELMNENCIWIPDCEHYGGYTDRHVVLSKNNIESYLNIFNNFVLRSNEYFMKMKDRGNWNLEQLIKFHLEQNNVLHLVKEFPYVMYSVRNINETTRWAQGNYSNELGYYIKYHSEYDKSSYYKNEFEKSGLTIDEFYKDKHLYVATKQKFFHVTGMYNIIGNSGIHSSSFHNRDNIFTEYNKLLDLSSLSAKNNIDEENYERIILSGNVNHIQDVFRNNLKSLYKLWKNNYPCNILYTGPDVIFFKNCKFTDKFDKFMMFNYTDPKSGYGFNDYFNADVKFYPYSMDEKLWDIALDMEQNWPSYEDNQVYGYSWNYEQIIWNKMLWDQNISIDYALKPEYAYQFVSENINESDNFNNFNIKDAKIVHFCGTRNLFNKYNVIRNILQLEK